MKMKNFFFLLFVLFVSCSSNKNFDRIKIGMKSSEVVKLVGSPKQKMPMIICDWWMYDDPDRHVIVIGSDTVVNISTQKEFNKGMDDVKSTLDSLSRTLKNIAK